MCGIFGGHTDALAPNAEPLLCHRGPDQQSHLTFKDRKGRDFTMGMTRLNIVDHRDMVIPFQAAGHTIVFNGEVYNWRAIRGELEAKGVKFTTETDTEMVLHAYAQWGPACLQKFNGMFGFAIWNDGKVFLARDRVGKKPVFYFSSGEKFGFASEAKVFRDIELNEIDVCERLEFYFDEHTPFKNVYSLKPGEYLEFDTGTGAIKKTRWWTFPTYVGDIEGMDAALKEFIPLFEDACKIRKIADVPVTLFLSGGIDSSLIQAVLKMPVTYTVQFPEFKDTINEEQYVAEFAKEGKFEARVLRPTREEFFDTFPLLARHLEYPAGSFSVFPLFCLAKRARADGFRVALSGEGADEMFNGYYRNELLLNEDAMVEKHLRGEYAHLASRYFGTTMDRFCRMASRNGLGDIPMLAALFSRIWDAKAPFAHNLSAVEATIFMQPLLQMADRMSMANGLEVRNPFLDYRIVELSARLAPAVRYAGGHGKAVLREALKRLLGRTDLGILKRETKHGLPSPVNNWMLKRNTFDRKDWNQLLLGECIRQMSSRETWTKGEPDRRKSPA